VSGTVEDSDPPEPDYDANGVDRTLVRACLKDTPLECLQALEEMHQLAESVKQVGQLPNTELLDVGGHAVRVLTLEKLIELKQKLSRPKDKLMLMHLEAVREERDKARG
jgi:hypothetical protein